MDDATRIMDGKGVVYRREGSYYVRLHVGPNKYKHKSLRTGNKALAVKAAEKLCYELEFKVQHGIPIESKTFGDVVKEYVAFRRKQQEQGRTSAHNMRQIERVARFWVAYAGGKLITSIGNSEFRDYVGWRRDYYTTHPTSITMPRKTHRTKPSSGT